MFRIISSDVIPQVRQKNSMHKRLTYLLNFYSSMTVEMLRFKGLMVKEKALKEEVFGAR